LGTPLTILIAVGGLLWGVYQFDAQQQSDSEKALQQQQLTQLQEAANQQRVIDQQRENTLDTYLDRMSDLLLIDHLATSKPGDEVRALAKSRTDTALLNLDGGRRGILVRYLLEAGLINGPTPIISLKGANLTEAFFAGADLSYDYLQGANLSGANLNDTLLQGARYNTKTDAIPLVVYR
jgi:Pentapeptide repeats (8 copies)